MSQACYGISTVVEPGAQGVSTQGTLSLPFQTPFHMLHICHQILLPWSPSLMDGLLNYAKGQEIFISLLGPHPHPSEGVGRSFRAGEIYKVFEGTIFLPFSAASFSSAPQRTGQLAPAVCPGGGGRQGRGDNNGVGGGQAPPASLHQLCTASCCLLWGSPFLLSSVW